MKRNDLIEELKAYSEDAEFSATANALVATDGGTGAGLGMIALPGKLEEAPENKQAVDAASLDGAGPATGNVAEPNTGDSTANVDIIG